MFRPRTCQWFARARGRVMGRLFLILLLSLTFSSCRKRANPVPVTQLPSSNSSTADHETGAESEPAETPDNPGPANAPETTLETSPPEPWAEADVNFSSHDFQAACSAYQELQLSPVSDLPEAVLTKAILSCAVASPKQRAISREWLDQLLSEESLQDPPALLLAVERLVVELESQNQTMAAQKRELEQLSEELEKLKKIDSQRRRP